MARCTRSGLLSLFVVVVVEYVLYLKYKRSPTRSGLLLAYCDAQRPPSSRGKSTDKPDCRKCNENITLTAKVYKLWVDTSAKAVTSQ